MKARGLWPCGKRLASQEPHHFLEEPPEVDEGRGDFRGEKHESVELNTLFAHCSQNRQEGCDVVDQHSLASHLQPEAHTLAY